MAKTLFLVEDSAYNGLPETVRKKAVAEVQKLFAFVSTFKVATKAPAQFPARIDFSDAIVKIVETEAEIGAVENQSVRQQLKNIEFSVTQNGVKLASSDPKRLTVTPERGGVGFQLKQVIEAGSNKMAMTVTGGIAAVETAKQEVLDHFAGGQSRRELMEEQQKALNGTFNRKGRDRAKYEASDAGKQNKARLKVWDYAGIELKNWPKDYQEAVGVGLARIIAHEARHQYVAPHFDGGGLGAGEADIYGDNNFADFDPEDRKEISTAITALEQKQRTANIHLETIPNKQPFIF